MQENDTLNKLVCFYSRDMCICVGYVEVNKFDGVGRGKYKESNYENGLFCFLHINEFILLFC